MHISILNRGSQTRERISAFRMQLNAITSIAPDLLQEAEIIAAMVKENGLMLHDGHKEDAAIKIWPDALKAIRGNDSHAAIQQHYKYGKPGEYKDGAFVFAEPPVACRHVMRRFNNELVLA
jgi:hypothetical protein